MGFSIYLRADFYALLRRDESADWFHMWSALHYADCRESLPYVWVEEVGHKDEAIEALTNLAQQLHKATFLAPLYLADVERSFRPYRETEYDYKALNLVGYAVKQYLYPSGTYDEHTLLLLEGWLNAQPEVWLKDISEDEGTTTRPVEVIKVSEWVEDKSQK